MDLLTRLVKDAARLPDMDGYMAIERRALLRDLKAATPIRIQNVADYLFLETDQESFHLSQDFPNVAPPWPIFFMSYRMPARSRLKDKWGPNQAAGLECGHLFAAEEDNLTGDWTMRSVFWGIGLPRTVMRGVIWRVNKDGECLAADGSRLTEETAFYRVTPFFQWPTGEVIGHTQFDPAIFFAPFLAISFCHCKNVDILREAVPPKVKAKRERLRGWSPSAWHSLRIEPMRRQLAEAGANEPGGLKRSLHIMRGHFKDYRDGRGLFGKIHGMWWWDFRLTDSTHKHRYEITPGAD
jgi:hypothetical protein